MERGFFKVWRKIKDSQSYNRSALHRAILLTIFVDANWKGGFFCGREVAPGQIATSIKSLSEELREPRTNVQRALRDIEKDGVIKLENVGNRWTMITLVNWGVYQNKDEKSGQPVDNQWSTNGQPVGIIKEGKKERRKEEDSLRSSSCPEHPVGDSGPSPAVLEAIIALPLNTGEDHPVTQGEIDQWQDLYPAVDVLQSLRSMCGWLMANKQRRKTKSGINRFIQSWLAREQDKGGVASRASPARAAPQESQADRAARLTYENGMNVLAEMEQLGTQGGRALNAR